VATKPKGNPFARQHLRASYRSGLEVTIAAALAAVGITALYEQVRIPFTQPAKSRTYTPDFALPNGIIVETKGIWDASDREKHKLVKDQHPDLDIRLVFSSSKAKIAKGSSTTYAMVATKLGIPFADKQVPPSWLAEPVNEKSLLAYTKLIKR
jgi:hypothetical protein